MIRIRILTPHRSVPLVFMDDTGATSPTITPADITALNLLPNYFGWLGSDEYETDNGVVFLRRVILDAAFLDPMTTGFPPVTPYLPFTFAVSHLQSSTRLGGPGPEV
jgi:hypothetical protein